MNFEEFKMQHNKPKIVTATLSFVNEDKGFCFLIAKEARIEKIFLFKKLLLNKGIDKNNLMMGDIFEVEIADGEKGWSVSTIIEYTSVKPIPKEAEKLDNSKIMNFAIRLHKTTLFDTNFKIVKINDKQIEKHSFDPDICQLLTERQKINARTLTNGLSDFTLKPDWRLAIGLGSGSVFETSMSLHHIYGFPYIPASAVKGALRSYLITSIFEKTAPETEKEFSLLNAEYRAYQDIDFCKIFGCPAKYGKIEFDENNQPKKNEKGDYIKKQKDVALKNSKGEGQEHIGSIVFLDAYPTESPTGKIKADIMNPHYPKYYNGDLPPADWQNPVPIIFLTVENLPFQFIIGLCKGVDNFNVEIGEYKGKVVEQVALVLKHALQNHGIGAKTAVGYGYMKEPTKS